MSATKSTKKRGPECASPAGSSIEREVEASDADVPPDEYVNGYVLSEGSEKGNWRSLMGDTAKAEVVSIYFYHDNGDTIIGVVD